MIEDSEIDGRAAWVARPRTEAATAGAVVVCHGGGGLGPHERGVIARLAELGYAAVAPDLFGDPATVEARASSDAGKPVPDAMRAQIMGTIQRLVAQPAVLRGRVGAAIESARAHASRVAVIGYCFGGTAALEAARARFEVACVVAFHGGLAATEPATQIATRVLACAGGADPHCPPQQRAAFEAEMTSAGADWQLHVYGGVRHAFSVRGSERIPGCAYDERADRRSWAATIGLLDETIRA